MFVSHLSRTPRSTLFPYTTLFRSGGAGEVPAAGPEVQESDGSAAPARAGHGLRGGQLRRRRPPARPAAQGRTAHRRSEERRVGKGVELGGRRTSKKKKTRNTNR